MRRFQHVLLCVVLGTGACGSPEERAPAPPDDPLTVSDVGFRTPESALHDPVADVYLVSNINGSPLAADGNGFISRIAPDGTVRDLRWIDGAAEGVTLHAPKGMALRGDTLFVADLTVVRLFHRETGAPAGAWEVPGSTFLNDVAVDPGGTVYVTDSGLRAGSDGFEPSGTDALYKFDPDGTPVRLTSGSSLGAPNGITPGDGRLLLVSFGSGAVFSVDPESGQTSGLPEPPAGQLDGVVRLDDGSILMSSWEGQAVYRMGPGGQYTVVADSLEAPADIGYDRTRRRILVPLFTMDRLRIVPLEGR